jgi:hypothetical protein
MNNQINQITKKALESCDLDPNTPHLESYTQSVVKWVVEECAVVAKEPLSYPYPDFYQKIKAHWQ